MSFLPTAFIDSLEGVTGFDRQSFVEVHASGQPPVSIRINPLKFPPNIFTDLPLAGKVPWCKNGFYLDHRPSFTLDPSFHAGSYYVQEASSMFLEQVLQQTCNLNASCKILDLCAAPGGKSTHIQSLVTENTLLVSNEVIRQRVNVLEENCVKWGGANMIVTSNDARDFTRLENYFDIIIVDAPCSGSGLFRKDPSAVNEWSVQQVEMCAGRQQRILTDVLPSLNENGVLIYATCSYSPKENEEICDWLVDHFSLTSISLQCDPTWNIVETNSVKSGVAGYRFFPHLVRGEGFFIACFRKESKVIAKEMKKASKNILTPLTRKQTVLLQPFLENSEAVECFTWDDRILAFPTGFSDHLSNLKGLHLRIAGICVGRVAHDELLPDHGLALSGIIRKNFVGI
ncbi:MAG TPA: RsmB/NOP family class I SAM-dependent RNA methyltransferase, partial [Flavitalea sp.]|nr:RsmB/NOP family class I SAM-dependent RNA methyltransferase [Flavitalea sp.]